MKIKQILILIFLGAVLFGCKSRNMQSSDKKWIRSEVTKAMQDHNIPGLAVGVVKQGKLYFLDGFGKSRRDSKRLVDQHSIFQIASQSKPLTGIIVRNLMQEGKLDPEQSIAHYLSDLLEPQALETLQNVKLKSLLRHSAGVDNTACKVYRERIDGEHWTKGYSKEELVEDLNNLKLSYEPDNDWQYSNSGYAIVGLICETVAKRSYEQLLEEYVAEPYNLSNTTVHLNDLQKANLLTPYKPSNRMEETRPSDMGMATPGSAVYSSIEDLTKLLHAQMRAYSRDDKESPLFLTEAPSATTMGDNMLYGYGLIMQDDGDASLYGHGGDADGFGCEYMFIPKKNIGVVLLSTSGGDWMQKLSFDILGRLQGQGASKRSIAFAMLKIIEKQGIEQGLSFFEAEKSGDEYQVVEDELNGLGYKLMAKDKLAEAIRIFELNVREHPESGNVYDSLGEAYLKDGQTEKAIANYKKSVELDPSNQNAINILKKYE